MGIDKGNTNYDVVLFKSTYGIQFPGVSGDEGGGNGVHFLYDIQGTPTVVVIAPDKSIASHWVWPPNADNIIDSVLLAGGIPQECITATGEQPGQPGFITIRENPFRQRVHFTIQPAATQALEVVVRDLSGRKVAGLPPASYPATGSTAWIEMQGLPVGMYFLHVVRSEQVLETKKIILRR